MFLKENDPLPAASLLGGRIVRMVDIPFSAATGNLAAAGLGFHIGWRFGYLQITFCIFVSGSGSALSDRVGRFH